MYEGGPDPNHINADNVHGGSSYAAGNHINSSNAIENNLIIQNYGVYSLKGTFDTLLPYNLYRAESTTIDSSEFRFIWGKVYVGDTSSSLPMRQVMLHWGLDSNLITDSTDKVRDSIFRTEVFDLPVGADIKYWRGIFLGDSLLVKSGGSLYGSGKGVFYTVELVFDSVTVDTIETLSLSPSAGKYFSPDSVTIINARSSMHDVYLRVRGKIITDTSRAISTMFEDIAEYDGYPTVGDTEFTIYKKGYPQITPSTTLAVANPYPDPSYNQGYITIPVYFLEGYPVKAEIYDALGRVIGSKTLMGSGAWQSVIFDSPKSPGSYLVRITAAGEQKTVMFTVVK
jgi:hypothetical protein